MKTTVWNPVRGCHKISSGCKHCYIALGDQKKGRDFNHIELTSQYDRIIRKNKKGEYVIPSNTLVYTCFSSDFFLEELDNYRHDWWAMIKERNDLSFLCLTKRIDRIDHALPLDFPLGYEHFTIGVSVENQSMADYRLPFLLRSSFQHKLIVCQPLLDYINLDAYLAGIEAVVVGGEAGKEGREMDYAWVLKIRDTCIKHRVSFSFRQTSSNFIKDGITHHIPWRMLSSMAKSFDLDVTF
ncbi:MAG: hypothetical protein A2Y45_06420 [Tenericutes bacterium GWC2_34_14]|nr:MAG: hypothetical protein A2Z84_06595 [Tenericutes bacterium GWA2_35_7]OHE28588.1 MAG: hypothetical protein A2Y45_06420 [Tenericutes bacterium GWC2_34_14]OHE33504.1 MAG: hypothetical protein A2012_03390 [Tenericutes bacterium GWE2_34_108]OHE36789.1 MAG: hypothetical protein A2Y46_09190 [Tenericutes bacterium GWF1_35_14]OHE38131.1 MAG: hypothetical protein A2Y44_09475 [Tenericutes bacterium GWF2_35_184]OHE42153.1 MAG: hypothetical protein A3K26_07135 [Tenericutes bacterium RIFOXYA12_FULL_35_